MFYSLFDLISAPLVFCASCVTSLNWFDLSLKNKSASTTKASLNMEQYSTLRLCMVFWINDHSKHYKNNILNIYSKMWIQNSKWHSNVLEADLRHWVWSDSSGVLRKKSYFGNEYTYKMFDRYYLTSPLLYLLIWTYTCTQEQDTCYLSDDTRLILRHVHSLWHMTCFMPHLQWVQSNIHKCIKGQIC